MVITFSSEAPPSETAFAEGQLSLNKSNQIVSKVIDAAIQMTSLWVYEIFHKIDLSLQEFTQHISRPQPAKLQMAASAVLLPLESPDICHP